MRHISYFKSFLSSLMYLCVSFLSLIIRICRTEVLIVTLVLILKRYLWDFIHSSIWGREGWIYIQDKILTNTLGVKMRLCRVRWMHLSYTNIETLLIQKTIGSIIRRVRIKKRRWIWKQGEVKHYKDSWKFP